MDTVDILRRVNVSYRQLDYWVRRGWLRPDQTIPGPGNPREWTNDELDVAIRMGKLVRAGIAPDIAAAAARKGSEVWLSPKVKVTVLP